MATATLESTPAILLEAFNAATPGTALIEFPDAAVEGTEGLDVFLAQGARSLTDDMIESDSDGYRPIGVNQLEESLSPELMDVDGNVYRRMGLSRRRLRDLTPLQQEKMLRIVHWLYASHPLARRIIDMTAEFCVEGGIRIVAKDPRIQTILDNHWNDPDNKWPLYQFERFRDLCLTGEACYPVSVNPHNGHVKLGHIDPGDIYVVMQNADNLLAEDAVILKLRPGDVKQRALRLVSTDNYSKPENITYGRLVTLPDKPENEDEITIGQRYLGYEETIKDLCSVKWTGSCFYFALNRPLAGSRGRSDLLSLIDLLGLYDDFVMSRTERVKHMMDYAIAFEMRGKTAAQLKKIAKEYRPPKPNSAFFHNENTKITPINPDLKSEDASGEWSILRNYVLAGAGYPPHFFAEGGGTARATAPEMHEPVYKMLHRRQLFYNYAVSTILKFVVDQAIIHGRLPKRINTEFTLEFPMLSIRDIQRESVALKNIAEALEKAVAMEAVTKDEIKRVFRRAIEALGFDVGRNVRAPHLNAPGRDELTALEIQS